MKLGSLFDGIGGWPLAAIRHGITPVWSSEIEPFPISVTKKHFPNMKHLGDLTKINGAEIEPVDVITFGSPCQDLSVAGKRAGLEGARSGLFMEAVRIIREMRDSTDGIYPRFAVWENVPGAFSSNKGDDFRAVLEEITESKIPIPSSGKWATSGMVRGNRVEVAWRVLDAQYWGVPQRRKRIFLVADFGGCCAGEVLFKPEGMPRYLTESGSEGQRVARGVKIGVGESGSRVAIPINTMTVQGRPSDNGRMGSGIGENGDPANTISTAHHHAVCVGFKANSSIADSTPVISELTPPLTTTSQMAVVHPQITGTLCASGAGMSRPAGMGNETDLVVAYTVRMRSGCEGGGKGALVSEECSLTLATGNDQTLFQPIPINDKATRYKGGGDTRNNDGAGNGLGIGQPGDPMPTLTACDRHAVAYADGSETCATVTNKWHKGTGGPAGDECQNLVIQSSGGYAVRRLTPTECERLQGLPDGYTAGGSDTQRYKALGNGMAQPCPDYVMEGIANILLADGK